MNITNIQASQISQNAVSMAEKIQAASTRASVNETATPQIQPSSISAGIGYLKEQLDSILVSYPPFFPLGTYQRLDLIKKIKGIQEDVQKSSIDAGLKKTITTEKLPVDATDQQISTSLDKLFTLRNTLDKDRSVASEPVQPGAILDIKV